VAEIGACEGTRQVHEMMRRLISRMVDDVIAETARRLAAADAASPGDIRRAGRAMVDFSGDMRPEIAALRAFLFEHMYHHDRVQRDREIAARIVRELFELYMGRVDLLPEEWRFDLVPGEIDGRARRVADFIAGMTDRFAIRQYETWFAPIPEFG
jgi:dGTPase